jgi:hypothetical protein
MSTISLYTNVFTISSEDPKTNKYLQIYILWLSQLIHENILTENDEYFCYIDKRSFEYLKNNQVFDSLLSSLKCKIKINILDIPETFKEGCCNRFLHFPDYQCDILIYCDIDILLKNNIRNLFIDNNTSAFYVHPEGSLTDLNYSAHFSDKEKSQFTNLNMGFSSGKFAIKGKELAQHFFISFNIIYNSSRDADYYCMDQALYNYILYTHIPINLINVSTIKYPIVCANLCNYDKKECAFLDFMGEPGNQVLHFDKIILAIALAHSNLL